MTSYLEGQLAVVGEGLFKIVGFLPCWRASDGRPGRWRGGAGDGPTQGAHRQHALTARDVGDVRNMLRELLNTWENWNTRTTLINTLLRGHGDQARDVLDRDIDNVPEVHPLEALRANSELVRLLSGWQWQAVYDARWRGHTWPQIAQALGVTVEQARAGYTEVIDRQELLLGRDVDLYRAVL